MKPQLDVISSTIFVALKTVFPKKRCVWGGTVPSRLLLACETCQQRASEAFLVYLQYQRN